MPANLAPDLTREIRLQRKRRGLSQADLGRRLRMPQSQIARIEKGDSDIRLSTLVEMARALDLEPMLVPKHLISPVRYMIDAPTEARPGAPKLVGNDPEDVDDEQA
jgi:HTH-type transcriptional regulator/antitoxin HipB